MIINATTTKKYFSIKKAVKDAAAKEGTFLSLQVFDTDKKVITENTYWMPDSKKNYSVLQKIKKAELTASAKFIGKGKVAVTLSNKQANPLAFFNRISLVYSNTSERLLPSFYTNNYITILRASDETIIRLQTN